MIFVNLNLNCIECPQVVSTDHQCLPLESVALFYNGSKISGECGREIRFQIGKIEARTFYINQLGWYATTFDNVDWESRNSALHGKPDMFKMWLFKQYSSFCATGKNMGRWFGSKHTACPNCGQPDEDSEHLLHCRDTGRYSLFRLEVNKLVIWLREGSTDPALATILSEYLLARGSKRLDALNLPAAYQRFAYSQELIGWDNFMLGMVSMHLLLQILGLSKNITQQQENTGKVDKRRNYLSRN
jgi:hypothetical protein